MCLGSLRVDEKSQTFYMYNEIATYETCDIETLRDHMVSFIDTSVELDSDLHIAFLFTAFTRDDKHSFYNRNLTSVGVIAKMCFCRATNRLVSEKLCPRLELPYSVMRSLPPNKAREEMISLLRKKETTQGVIGNLEICIEDFMSLLSRVNAGVCAEHRYIIRHLAVTYTLVLFVS